MAIRIRGAEAQIKEQFGKIIVDDKPFTIGRKHGKLYKLNSKQINTILSCIYGQSMKTHC